MNNLAKWDRINNKLTYLKSIEAELNHELNKRMEIEKAKERIRFKKSQLRKLALKQYFSL